MMFRLMFRLVLRKRAWLAAAVLLACNGVSVAGTNDANISWTMPTTNCDGSAIGTITSTKIYYGTTGRAGAGIPLNTSGCGTDAIAPTDSRVATAYGTVLTVPAPATVKDIVFTVPGKYYFAATTVATQGESNLTNELSKTITITPSPPTLNSIACVSPCEVRSAVTLLIGDTASDVTIAWPAQPASGIEVELYVYPPKAGVTPLARASLDGTTTSWGFRANRAELLYTRMRSCNGADCSTWINSFDQGYLYYFRLAPASGGGFG